MKSKKIRIFERIICVAFFILVMFTALFACSNSTGKRNKIYIIESALSNSTLDIGATLEVTNGIVKTLQGEVQSDKTPNVCIYNPNGDAVSVSPTRLTLTIMGEWKVVYDYEEKTEKGDYNVAETLIIKFNCQDLSAPKVKISNYQPFLYTSSISIALPGFDIEDKSGLSDETTIDLYKLNGENWEKIDFNRLLNTFIPSTAGYYKYELKVVDDSPANNRKIYQYPMLIVDDDFVIPNLSTGYVAEFNDEIYKYFVSDGVAGGSYWSSAKFPESSFIENYQGSTNGGALKVSVTQGMNGARLKFLFPNLTPENSLDSGDILIMRYKGDMTCNWINYDLSQDSDSVYNQGRLNKTKISKPDKDGWRLLEIPETLITNSIYGEDKGWYGLRTFEVLSNTSEDFYFDYIKKMTRLSSPENVSIENGSVSFSAVPNAQSYIVKVNDTEYEIDTNIFTLPTQEDCVVMVKAIGDVGGNYYESDYSSITTSFNTGDYIADFDSAIYNQLVNSEYSKSLVSGAYKGWFTDMTTSIYEGKCHINYTVTDFSRALVTIALPKKLSKTQTLGDIVFRFKGAVNGVISNHSTEAGISGVRFIDDIDGYKLMVIPKTSLSDDVTMFGIMLEPNDSGNTFELDYIKEVASLNIPQNIIHDQISNKITWDEVPSAENYTVEIDGKEQIVLSNEIVIDNTEPHIIRVRANGDNRQFLSSLFSNPFPLITLQDTFLMEFNHQLYTDFIQRSDANISNTWKGNAYWTPSSLSVGCQNDFLEITYTQNNFNNAIVLFSLLKTYNVSELKSNIVVKFKGNIQNSAIFDGSTDSFINGTKIVEGNEGWRYFIIPTVSLSNTISAIGLNLGAPQEAPLIIDWIKNIPALSEPVLSFDGSTVSWNKVENALNYTINVNGQDSHNTLNGDTLSYAPQKDDIIKVRANGDNINYTTSNYSKEIIAKIIKKGYIAEFNSNSDEALVGHDNLKGGWYWKGSKEPKAEYTKTEAPVGATDGDALKITLTGSANNTAGFKITFPTVPEGNLIGATAIVMRYYGTRDIYFLNDAFESEVTTHVNNTILTDENNWKTVTIPLWMLQNSAYGLNSIEFLHNLENGTTTNYYFDWVKIVT